MRDMCYEEADAMRTEIADKRWAKKYPHLGTAPVPAEPCISPEYFELERDRVFRKAWLNVGRVEDIPKPGDYVVRNLDACKASILLIRGKDGVIRGFHNVCSHRGNKVVWTERGSCPGALSCGFHSWTFNTRGELTWPFRSGRCRAATRVTVARSGRPLRPRW